MRYPLVIGAAAVLVAGLAIPAAAAETPGPCDTLPGKTCTTVPLLCPEGYAPGPHQDPTGVICVYVGPGPRDRDLHAAVRVDPLLCAHVAVGNDARSQDVVRTLHCPRYVPPAPSIEPPTPPVAPPAADLPAAPAPTIVSNDLPVTH